MKNHYNLTEGLPEFRVPPMLIAGIVCPIGLFIYGWRLVYLAALHHRHANLA
jgi:hypothetical protein